MLPKPLPLKDNKCPACGSDDFLCTETLCWQGATDQESNRIDFYKCYENSVDDIRCKNCGQEIDQTAVEAEFS